MIWRASLLLIHIFKHTFKNVILSVVEGIWDDLGLGWRDTNVSSWSKYIWRVILLVTCYYNAWLFTDMWLDRLGTIARNVAHKNPCVGGFHLRRTWFRKTTRYLWSPSKGKKAVFSLQCLGKCLLVAVWWAWLIVPSMIVMLHVCVLYAVLLCIVAGEQLPSFVFPMLKRGSKMVK